MQGPEIWVPRWQSIVDFVVLLGAVYLLLVWGKQARALRIALGLGGEISKEIIETIFRKVSPVHDGATIIENNRIARVAAILPLTERENIPSGYGTRHRAALGLAERSDAIIVVVSEEIGDVTLVHDSESKQIDQVQDLVRSLEVLCRHPAVEVPRLRRNLGLKGAAVGLAVLIWMDFLWPDGNERANRGCSGGILQCPGRPEDRKAIFNYAPGATSGTGVAL